jgi:hypothetical protein
MLLAVLFAIQISFHGVRGLSCNGVGTDVCNTATNTFTCDDINECASDFTTIPNVYAAIFGPMGTTSKCVGVTPPAPVCSRLGVHFHYDDPNEQGMTCEGEEACYSLYVDFPNPESKTGMVTCKGGD